LRNSYEEFKKANVAVFGVSVDSVYSHKAFAEHLGGLPYELIADFERKLVDSWGVRRTDLEGYDGVPRRSVFILDHQRKVRWRWLTSPEQRLPVLDEVLAEAKKVAGAGRRAPGPRKTPAKPRSTTAKPTGRSSRKAAG
jgi:peroxiredoxin